MRSNSLLFFAVQQIYRIPFPLTLAGRHCEFGRAALACIFDNSLPQISYMAYVRTECYSKVFDALSSLVYAHWDESPEGQPNTRPPESDAPSGPLGLKVLAIDSNNCVVWPDSILSKFPTDSVEGLTIAKMQKDFLDKFSASAPKPSPTSRPTAGPARAVGSPDFTIDGGAEPLDPGRCVDLEGIQSHDFTAERWLGHQHNRLPSVLQPQTKRVSSRFCRANTDN